MLRTQARTVLAIAAGRLEPINADPSFEDTSRGVSPAWSPWVKGGKGKIVPSHEAAHTGKSGLALQGIQRGGPHQSVSAKPGDYAATAYFRGIGDGERATVSLCITLLAADGAHLREWAATEPAKAGGLAVVGRFGGSAGGYPGEEGGESSGDHDRGRVGGGGRRWIWTMCGCIGWNEGRSVGGGMWRCAWSATRGGG